MLQQVISMLQHAPVRQRVRTLSMHSQVEPTGFTSETTRVRYHTRLYIRTDGHHAQVVANVTTSVVSFSILSPDASLSYDRIKLRLDEYRSLLASDSDTIELATENGKTVICRKQANEMEQFVDQAEILLEDVIQSRDISTLVVLHRLRDLSEVLDNLKLYDECRLTGNCALDLAEALGRRSIEFRNEQAETLALIAGLSVYKPRARALFIQAVSTCEEVVENDASYSNKTKLLNVLERAGFWAENHPDLCVQWLGRAVQLMTNELPPTMVTAHIYGIIHYNYGGGLKRLQQYTSSIKAYQNAISIYRMLAEDDPVKYTYDLAHTLTNMGRSLDALGQYDDAIAQYKEAIGLGRAMSAQDPLQCNEIIAKALHNYVQALLCSDRASEAVGPSMEAVSLFRDLAERGIDFSKGLAMCLQRYGECCNRLGRHADAVSAYQESIPIRRAQAARDPKESIFLMVAIHDMAHSLYALSRNDEADAAANEALQMDNGMVLDIYLDAPNFKSCLVCQRIITYDPSILDAGPSSPVPAIPPKVSHGRKRDKIFNLFRKNRAQ